ncbi:recombinase family protein [Brevundimonas sp.]|uniref:recombinase family protein n=2 Tax=Pseudomonadota TaxID=1224 RepID=UPI002896D926|nr:recombinase family protein [Brevundimonas sp.]
MSALPPPGTRYAVYARYSTGHQTFKSIEDQLTLCRAYAERQGWVEVGAYHDAERSGTTVIGRSGLFAMLAAADRGEFTVILVEDLDRLSRSASGTHGMLEEMEALDIVVCTVSSGVVSDMEVAFKAAQNARYVKGQAEKTRRGQEGTVKDGRISGQPAYGYRMVLALNGKNGQREPDPVQAAVVRRIMTDYVAGMTPLEIAKALNAEGVPGPRGGPWLPGAIYGNRDVGTGVLRNRLYVGVNEWGRTVTKHNRHKGTSKAKVTPQGERLIIPVPHLRIVEDDLFQAVQDRIESRRVASSSFRGRRRPDYLLSGLIRCGVCGKAYAVVSDKLSCIGSAREGTCDNRRRVAREDLEDLVLRGLKGRLLKPELIEPYLAEYRAEIERANAELAARTEAGAAHLKEVERQIANIMDTVRDGRVQGLAGELMMKELERLEAERQRFERQTKVKPRPAPAPLEAEAVVARLDAMLDDLRLALAGDDREAARARDTLRGLIERVTISPIELDRIDKRGQGPVRVTVEGPLSGLVDLADDNGVILHSSHPGSTLDPATVSFRYYVDYVPEDNRLDAQTYADLSVFARLLDDADVPVTRRKIIHALVQADGYDPDWTPDYGPNSPFVLRALNVIRYLKKAGDVRAVALDPARSGHVWNHIQRSDDDWKARAMAAPAPVPEGAHGDFPIVRISAPEAFVVVIGPGEKRQDSEDDKGA